MSETKLTEAQAKALTWMRDNEYHYGAGMTIGAE